jgi:hypothetical protein
MSLPADGFPRPEPRLTLLRTCRCAMSFFQLEHRLRSTVRDILCMHGYYYMQMRIRTGTCAAAQSQSLHVVLKCTLNFSIISRRHAYAEYIQQNSSCLGVPGEFASATEELVTFS